MERKAFEKKSIYDKLSGIKGVPPSDKSIYHNLLLTPYLKMKAYMV